MLDDVRTEHGRAATPRALGAAVALAMLLAVVPIAGSPAPAEAARVSSGCGGAHRSPSRIGYRAAEQAVRCLFNRHRSSGDSLAYDPELAAAAARHNRRMVDQRCFSHRCGGEPDTERRVRRAGYPSGAGRWGYGEVIGTATGRGAPAGMVRDWLDSTPHRQVILDPEFEHVGVAVTRGTPRSREGFTYTANFGYRGG